MNNSYQLIKKDKQIKKFCLYGLLKNLKFFEPYLLIYLLGLGMNLFSIGILYSIREIIIYIFEIPSGIFADNYGKKKELMICFTFYIISFGLFFFGSQFYILVLAMVFFGLGEAFRSGTHKAMIYSYLEQKDWFMHKTYVYGRTRSFSLIGSSVSAFVSILFVLNLPSVKWIFLLCIIPYLLDFLLIASYPNNLNEKRKSEIKIATFYKDSIIQIKSIFRKSSLIILLLSSSLYDSIFKVIKDYIQPILQDSKLVMEYFKIPGIRSEDQVVIALGVLYGVFYIFSSMASKNVYRINRLISSGKLMGIFFDIMAILCLIMFITIHNQLIILTIITFFVLYILKDARRPIFVDVCGDTMEKHERATVLSVDSQFRALFTIIFAPLFGLIADRFSISYLFLIISIFIFIINHFLKIEKIAKQTDMSL